jgi:hypothetical protein
MLEARDFSHVRFTIQSVPYRIFEHFIEKKLVIICPNWGILKFKLKLKEDLSMNKFIFMSLREKSPSGCFSKAIM